MEHQALIQNSITETPNTFTDFTTAGNNNSAILTNDLDTESVDVQLMDLNDSLENYTAENITIPEIDTTGIVMQTTDYTCGPAALATVLNNLGINATEQELASLAGTDENGTTMYGLVEAAKAKGLSAIGMKLKIDELKKNNIVFLTIDGTAHYSVIKEIINEIVKLADPNIGNIEMSVDAFISYYSGYALVINYPNAGAKEVNQTENETSEHPNNVDDTNSTINSKISKILNNEEMQSIKGRGSWIKVWVYGEYWTWYHWRYGCYWSYWGYQKGGYLFTERWGWYIKYYWGKEVEWHEKLVFCTGTLPWNYVRYFTPRHAYNNPYY